ncbi:MAG: hypothetical protein ACI9VS_002726 [Candidatus Binatia bacterium]|jgi:hypothetical protein
MKTPSKPNADSNQEMDRRDFLKLSGTAALATAAFPLAPSPNATASPSVDGDGFKRADSLFHGGEWESLNPGYWQIKDNTLRRRFENYGDRARGTGFPFHYETHERNGGLMPVDYDPSLPPGVIYHRGFKSTGEIFFAADFTYHGDYNGKRENDADDWKMYQPGYGMMGLALGAKSLFESYGKIRNAMIIGWTDNGKFGFLTVPRNAHSAGKGKASAAGKRIRPLLVSAPKLTPGKKVSIHIDVKPAANGQSEIVAKMFESGDTELASVRQVVPTRTVAGYLGVAARGLTDFSVSSFNVLVDDEISQHAPANDCHVCYPLGDTLKLVDGKWRARFVGLFASDGKKAEIRISDSPSPKGGWKKVKVAGAAKIVSNKWRRNTATIHTTLPANPADKELYYTVWKDGKNVTSDPRIGTDAVGPGTGFVGDVPASGAYVGRLPQLKAPYKICGLSCHALTSGLQQRTADGGLKILGGGDDWQFRDQPTVEAYKYLEDYNFQVMCWEDDVWYLELMLYPPSTDDAYKVVTMSIAGPTSRWQMMRHWNVLNPGDHDYGMDDVKGPEQIVIRLHDGLGQDRDYMRRNFQIVQHLITGDEEVDPLANPKKWRAWKMPNRDFTFAILDSRLWRSSQDTAMWDDEGWGHMRELYDRADPTRSLLGEEQFAWLQQLIRTDSSRQICLTGINGMHTVWTGGKKYSKTDNDFDQRDRVAADYAGWVAAGSDRVIELLGSRDGVVTVYGDVHNGCIMKNTDHGLIECSFGPIGRSGGRAVIKGFGPKMKDYDKRPLEVTALYHKTHADPKLTPQAKGAPFYWNFLEMEFDPTKNDPAIGLRLRNMIDAPKEAPRGGAPLETAASATGRKPTCKLPTIKTLPNADVRFSTLDGRPIRGARSDANGAVSIPGLVGPKPGDKIMVSAQDGKRADASLVITLS